MAEINERHERDDNTDFIKLADFNQVIINNKLEMTWIHGEYFFMLRFNEEEMGSLYNLIHNHLIKKTGG